MTNSVNYAVSPAQAEVNTLVEQGLVELEQFRQFNQEQVDFIVAKRLLLRSINTVPSLYTL